VFLVEDRRFGTTYLVFTWSDPRKEGYTGNVVENVALDYDMESVHSWPEGDDRPDACIGRAPDDPNQYKVFKYDADRAEAGYAPVEGMVVLVGSWSEYVRLHLDPPDPEQTGDEQWYDYLDKLDEASRQRRRQPDALVQPLRGDRDSVAEWLARKHLIADAGIREVWYLPQGAPPNEIRLLELNDRFAGNELSVDAIDFGVDVQGANFRLVVADITSDQLADLKHDPSRLPSGWSLDGNRIWGRRGA
jgi:hypothetical protein